MESESESESESALLGSSVFRWEVDVVKVWPGGGLEDGYGGTTETTDSSFSTRWVSFVSVAEAREVRASVCVWSMGLIMNLEVP